MFFSWDLLRRTKTWYLGTFAYLHWNMLSAPEGSPIAQPVGTAGSPIAPPPCGSQAPSRAAGSNKTAGAVLAMVFIRKLRRARFERAVAFRVAAGGSVRTSRMLANAFGW